MTDTVKVTVTHDGKGFTSDRFGRIYSATEGLADTTLVSVALVNAGLRKRQPVCAFAQMNGLRAGTGYVTRDGMFVLQNESRFVVYELFPATWADPGCNAEVYVGVKRSDCHL